VVCRICGRQIVILINQGTGICCEECRAIENGERTYEQIVDFIAQVNPFHITQALKELEDAKRDKE
jgi:hypothetical protein